MKIQLILVLLLLLGLTACTPEQEALIAENEALATAEETETVANNELPETECVGVQCLPCFHEVEGCSSAETKATEENSVSPIIEPIPAPAPVVKTKPLYNSGFVVNKNENIIVMRPKTEGVNISSYSYAELASVEGMELMDARIIDEEDLQQANTELGYRDWNSIKPREEEVLPPSARDQIKEIIENGEVSGVLFYKRISKKPSSNKFEYKIRIKVRDELIGMKIKLEAFFTTYPKWYPSVAMRTWPKDVLPAPGLITKLDPWKGVSCKADAVSKLREVQISAGLAANTHVPTNDFRHFIEEQFVGQTEKGYNVSGFDKYVLSSFNIKRFQGKIKCASLQVEVVKQGSLWQTDGVALFSFPQGQNYIRYDCPQQFGNSELHCWGKRLSVNVAEVISGNNITINHDLSNVAQGGVNMNFVNIMNSNTGLIHSWVQDDVLVKRVTLTLKLQD